MAEKTSATLVGFIEKFLDVKRKWLCHFDKNLATTPFKTLIPNPS
jgi:hypothetical protein